jgi:glutathionylspermidine synthase
MHRISSEPRPGWQQTVRDQGVSLAHWDETACYVLDLPEVLRLEALTEELYGMCLAAVRHVIEQGRYADFGVPEWAVPGVHASLLSGAPSLCTRLDLWYDGNRPPKLLDCRSDVPDGLVETSIAQWYWLDQTRPDQDQWNSLHERLLTGWRTIAKELRYPSVHFGWSQLDPTGGDELAVGYLAGVAEQAGLGTRLIPMHLIGWDGQRFLDDAGSPIVTCFKRYPWEWMIREPYGRLALAPGTPTTWIEPPWKLLLSGTPLLATLWQLFPDHPNLVPAFTGRALELPQPPSFSGNPVVLTTWLVTGEDGRPHSAGAGFRESGADGYERFVPHYVTR